MHIYIYKFYQDIKNINRKGKVINCSLTSIQNFKFFAF